VVGGALEVSDGHSYDRRHAGINCFYVCFYSSFVLVYCSDEKLSFSKKKLKDDSLDLGTIFEEMLKVIRLRLTNIKTRFSSREAGLLLLNSQILFKRIS